MGDNSIVIGFDLGGTKMHAAAVDVAGHVIHAERCKTVAADDTTSFTCVKTPDDVTDSTTLFCDVAEATLTYYFNASDDSWCGVSGPDASYYADYGCEAL